MRHTEFHEEQLLIHHLLNCAFSSARLEPDNSSGSFGQTGSSDIIPSPNRDPDEPFKEQSDCLIKFGQKNKCWMFLTIAYEFRILTFVD